MFIKHFCILFGILAIPSFVLAHTSDQRFVDGYIVDLASAPVAPWVSEKVGMSFVFRDSDSLLATTSVVSATISIDATMRPNNKLQEVVFESQKFEVGNGGFVTSHTFTEEGTYDLHVTFVDSEGKEHLAGFRKQVRSGEQGNKRSQDAALIFGVILSVSLLGFIAGRLYRPKS